MPSAAKVRPASAQDRQRLLDLWLDLVEHHRHLDPRYPSLPGLREVLLGEIASGLERSSCRIWLAEIEGEPVGFLFAELEAAGPSEPAAAWIHELYVARDHRRRGIASILVDAADAWFADVGAPRARVRVEPGNRPGLGFWSARGFVEKSRLLERENS